MDFEQNSFFEGNDQDKDQDKTQEKPPDSYSKSQPSIDQLTMELMMNKSHYHKYLSKKNPQKYQEAKETANKVDRYYPKIMEITETLLADFISQNSNEKYTREVNDVFQDYMKTCVKYLEMRDLEREDEEMLFGKMDSRESVDPNRSDVFVRNNVSLWGKTIRKMGP
jgi:hypothetical protein